MAEPIPFSLLPSHTPVAPHRTAERLDPYWDGVWQLGSSAVWVSREHSDRLEAAKVRAVRPKVLRADPAVASRRLLSYEREAKLDALGALSGWRTMTAEQLAATTGHPAMVSPKSKVISDLFALDLLDTGSVWAPGAGGAAASRAQLLRPSRTRVFDRQVRPLLSYAEWVSVSGGGPFLPGGQFDRHNVLATELGLRVAEFHRVATVLSERDALVEKLAFTGAGAQPPVGGSQQTADAVIVRSDGLRIAVEVTASIGQRFNDKLDRWTSVLAARPVEDNGLVVVFVVADRPGGGARERIGAAVRKRVARAVRRRPGVRSNRTADRMFVAEWRDWFPERGAASAEFRSLSAFRPAGADGDWEAVPLMTAGTAGTPVRLDGPLTVVGNSSGLRSTPHWLRSAERPQLWGSALRGAGFDRVPHVRLSARTGAPIADPLAPKAGVPAAAVPQRLRF